MNYQEMSEHDLNETIQACHAEKSRRKLVGQKEKHAAMVGKCYIECNDPDDPPTIQCVTGLDETGWPVGVKMTTWDLSCEVEEGRIHTGPSDREITKDEWTEAATALVTRVAEMLGIAIEV